MCPVSTVQTRGFCSTLQLLVHAGRRRQRSSTGPGRHLWGQRLHPCQRGLNQTHLTASHNRQSFCRDSAVEVGVSLSSRATNSFTLPFCEQKFNNEWWIGRPVKEDGVVGFVPSPVNLETILIRREVQARKAAKALAKYVRPLSLSSHVNTFCSVFCFFVFNKSTSLCCHVLTNSNNNLYWPSACAKGSLPTQRKHGGLCGVWDVLPMLYENRLVRLQFGQCERVAQRAVLWMGAEEVWLD